MRKRPLTAVVLSLSLLAACGGGSGGGGGDNANGGDTGQGGSQANTGAQSAEGIWSGVSSTGTTMNLAILENGESWGVYTSTQGSFISGALQGQTQTSGTNLTGSGRAYDFTSGKVTMGDLVGQVQTKTSLVADSLAGFTVNLNYNMGYDTRASLSDLAGKYLIFGRSGREIIIPDQVEISGAGVFTNFESGCTRTGTFVPRASGKNVFNLSVSYSGTCSSFASGSVLRGIAFLDKTTTPHRLHSLSLNSDKSDGVVIIGTKHLP